MRTQTILKTTNFLPATWKGGYMHTPQAIRELLARERISGIIQCQILLEINGEQSRQGDNGQPAEWAKDLTIPKFAAACGRDPKEQLSGVEKALADLIKRGLVVREPNGKTWTNAGKVQARAWKYAIAPNAWAESPKYVAPVEDGDQDTATEDDPTSEEPESAPKTWTSDRLIAMPGPNGSVMRLGDTKWQLRVVGNDMPIPVGFELTIAEKDVIEMRFQPAAANDAIAQFPGVEVESKGLNPKTSVLWEGSPSPSLRPQTSVLEEGSRDDFDAFVLAEVMPLTGNVPSREILSATRSHLNGTPIEYLRDRLRAKAAKYKSHALLPHLARDASERYQAERKLTQATPVEPTSRPRITEEPADTLWGRMLTQMQAKLSRESYDNWLRSTRQIAVGGGFITVQVPDEHTQQWITSEYGQLLREALLQQETDVRRIRFAVGGAA